MRRHAIFLFGASTLLLAAAAAGDWLVLRDGSRLETSGPWQVKGRQVVFTRPGGTLAAFRLADVDLEASDAATANSRAVAPPVEPGPPRAGAERRPSVLRLTDKDMVPPAPDPAPEDEAEAGDPETEADPDAGKATGEPVRLVAWQIEENSERDGLEITGSVRNGGDAVAATIRVQVMVLDEDDNPVAARAFLAQSSLAPGSSTTFRAFLSGVYPPVEDPTFEVTSEAISIQGTAKPKGEVGDEAGDEIGDEETAAEPPP